MAAKLLLLLHLGFLCSIAFANFLPLDRSSAAYLFELDTTSSLEHQYQTLRSLQVLGVEPNDLPSCGRIVEVLTSPSDEGSKSAFYAARIAKILSCQVAEEDAKSAVANLLSSLNDAGGLLDLHFAIGTIATIKELNWIKDDLDLGNAVQIYNKITELGQGDGTWKFSMNDGESNSIAAGIAIETLADLISISGDAIERSMLAHIEGSVNTLFDSIESYDDGTRHFGPLAATSSVIRGVTAFAAAVPGRLKIDTEKIVGIAKFFLGAGVPMDRADAFYAIDALGLLEANSLIVPLVVSVPSSVISLTSRDMLEVSVTTVLGSPVPATVNLAKATKVGSKKASTLTIQNFKPVTDGAMHRLDILGNKFDLGKYDLKFEVTPAEQGRYSAGAHPSARIIVTGVAKVDNVEVGVLDSDTGSPDVVQKWNPSTQQLVTLYATHLQKLRLSLDVFSPLNEPFRPHQVFVKLRHESKFELLFLAEASGKHLELNLDFLGLVEKFNYLSGVYEMELIVGDVCMENPFNWVLGTLELDLPEPSEGVPKAFAVTDGLSKYGPKPEITHVFRPAEKRPPSPLSNAFLFLTLVPLLGFLVGIKLLNTNVKSFPTSGLPLFSALCFHGGIASILGLYVLFWLKFNLFETLKYLGVLAIFLVIPGHSLLSYLADSSTKLKTA